LYSNQNPYRILLDLYYPTCSSIIILTSSVTVNFLVRFSQDGWTAMIWAAQEGHLGVVALLLNRGANIEAADKVNDYNTRVTICNLMFSVPVSLLPLNPSANFLP